MSRYRELKVESHIDSVGINGDFDNILEQNATDDEISVIKSQVGDIL